MVPNKIFDGLLNRFKFKDFNKVPKFLYALSAIVVAIFILYIFALIMFPHQLLSTVRFNPFVFSFLIFLPFFAYLTFRSSKLVSDASKSSYFTKSFVLLDLTLFCLFAILSLSYLYRFMTFLGVDISKIDTQVLRSALIPITFLLPTIFCVPLMNMYINFSTSTNVQKGIKVDFKVKVYSPKKKENNLSFFTTLGINTTTNKPVMVSEKKRMEGTLVQGATGTGKTSTVLLPSASADLEKKYMIKELAKELGYECLEKGIAKITVPISNEALNKNFSLKYLVPVEGHEKQFEEKLSDLIRYKDEESNQYFYRDAGVVVLEPDGEFIGNLHNVADNLGIKYLTVDPLNPDAVGINPFIGKEPAKVASIISNVLKGMYESEGSSDSNLFFTQVTQQAIENLSILLKVMYPRMHNGEIANLEDMLECLHDYNLVEVMCEELKRDPVLASEYDILLAYFEKNFYNPPLNDMGAPIAGTQIGSGRKSTEKFLYGATTQLDNILRQADVKRLLCSRDNNIDFDKALEEGTCITACSRRGALSSILSKAFGMFFILSFQDAVLRRPGNENTRTPFFFYIDEFPDFVNKETETCFTLFRKYRCGMIVAIQNLSQLERTKSMIYFKKVIISNTKTKIVFGGTNLDDSKFWEKELGTKFQWGWSYSGLGDETDGSEKVSVDAADEARFFYFNIAELPFKTMVYKTLNIDGNEDVDTATTDFLDERFYKPYPVKTFNFSRFIPASDTLHEDHPVYDYSNIYEPEVVSEKEKFEFNETPNKEAQDYASLDYLNVEKHSDNRINELSNAEIEALSDLMFETAMGSGIIPADDDVSQYVEVPDIDPNAIKNKK